MKTPDASNIEGIHIRRVKMKHNKNIIPQKTENIKAIKLFLPEYAAPKDKIVSTVQEIHPKFDEDLYDKCADPDYGVCIRSDAARMIVSRFVAESSGKSDCHKWKNRISCRLPDSEYDAIRDSMLKSGFTTFQEFLRAVLKMYAGVD